MQQIRNGAWHHYEFVTITASILPSGQAILQII